MRGTGFFIDDNGTFITANHVVAKRPSNSRLIYHGSIPHMIIPKPLEINIIYNDPLKDVCIGQIKDNFLQKVEFAETNPKIGTSICLSGYPISRISINDNGIVNFKSSKIRKYWQPTFVIDYWNVDTNKNTFITQLNVIKFAQKELKVDIVLISKKLFMEKRRKYKNLN